MSRKVEPKTSVTMTEEETALRKTEGVKLLFTSYQDRRCALLIQNGRLTEASFFSRKPGKVGAVYIGKVKNVAKNIDACFVEIAKGELCFLSMEDTVSAYLLNRSYDGRILEGDELLVQVVRDAQKAKRASVTAHISLSNDYFAISLGPGKIGYSTKLAKEKKEAIKISFTENAMQKNGCLVQGCDSLLSGPQYEKLKSEGLALEHFKLPPMGLVVRTRAGEIEPWELWEPFFDLSAQFIRLLYIAKYRSCFSCLKEAETEFEPIVRQFISEACMDRKASRDMVCGTAGLVSGGDAAPACEMANKVNGDTVSDCGGTEMTNAASGSIAYEIITDQESTYVRLQKYCEEHENRFKVRLYQDSLLPLPSLYSINSKMEAALGSRVWLKSGGYLIIEPTEALTVIDVNSGKCETGKGSRDTFRKINLEAAEEIAIQLRLRNLSGIIIVDFINMQSGQDDAKLLSRLRELVKRDKVKTTVVDMTSLGLVEITRKKINKPLKEQFLLSGAF